MAQGIAASSSSRTFRLFEAYGVELEYMVVHARTLNVMTAADDLLRKAAGADDYLSDVPLGEITASNEMTAHLIELKTTEPAPTFNGLAEKFQSRVQKLNTLLGPLGGILLPTGMHPWMDPMNETKIWPHEYSQVYTMYNRIFNCQGHGWSNLQSVHLNLPFADDAEFGRLHAAIRLILPILPALAASSPIFENRHSGELDSRLTMYRNNSRRIPSIVGHLIPEPVYTIDEYRTQVLAKMYADVAPFDPHGILHQEWLNGRAAIARFERNTIEIKSIDVQECPAADVAVLAAIVGVLKLLVAEKWTPLALQQAWQVESLDLILKSTTRAAEQAVIDDLDYLHQFGLTRTEPCTAGSLWRHLLEQVQAEQPTVAASFGDAWKVLLDRGPLARRILQAWDVHRSRERLEQIYRRLATCLAEGRMYLGEV